MSEYIVKKGDTLSSIAARQQVGLQELQRANKIKDINKIFPGQKLHIPSFSNVEYQVLPGDTLGGIAKQYNIPIKVLQDFNNIKNANIIHPGEIIKIPQQYEEEYQKKSISFDSIKFKEDQYSKENDIDVINHWYKRNKPGNFYVIDDKKNNTFSVYKDGKLIRSFKAIHGKNSNTGGEYDRRIVNPDKTVSYVKATASPDDMTVTYTNNGHIINKAGNLTTPAGVFFMSPAGEYRGAPSWMRQTEQMVNSNSLNGIAASIHARNIYKDASTNGCTGMSVNDLKELKKILGDEKHIPVYVLPSDPSNKFYIRNNQIQFKNTNGNQNIAQYKTLTYSPIDRIDYTGNFSEKQKQVVDQFIESLIQNKQSLQSDLKINSDTYNQLAIQSLGIIGKESNFGEEKNPISNFLRIAGRKIGLHSSPDIYSKYKTTKWFDNLFGNNFNNRSVGLSQLRMSYLSDESKALFQKYGIKQEDLVYNPEKAALATMIKLADEYKRQGLNVEKAVKSWNNSPSYYDSIQSIIRSNGFQGFATYKHGGIINYLDFFKQ